MLARARLEGRTVRELTDSPRQLLLALPERLADAGSIRSAGPYSPVTSGLACRLEAR